MKAEPEVKEVPAVLSPVDFKWEVRTPESWHEWLLLAKAAVTLDQKLGLLHSVFNVEVKEKCWDDELKMYRNYDYSDRLKFLFGVADGWKDPSALDWRNPEERGEEEARYLVGFDKRPGYHKMAIYRTEREQRQVLARKAFDLLCHNFFDLDETPQHKTSSDEVRKMRLEAFVRSPLFPVVQEFFRVTPDFFRYKVCNLHYLDDDRSPHEKIAVTFLLKLANFLWTWEEDISWASDEKKRDAQNTKTRELIRNAQPWMIEVLDFLRELRMLGNWLAHLDGASLVKLEEIAMRTELKQHQHPVEKDRTVTSIDEACYAGSMAAWLLKRRELVVTEDQRLRQIQVVRAQRRAVEQEEARLTRRGK